MIDYGGKKMIEYYNNNTLNNILNYNIRTNYIQSNVSIMNSINYYIVGGYYDNKFNFTNTII